MIYLHIGLHKTATTTFQIHSFKNHEKLLEIGLEYPTDADLTLGSMNHLGFSRDFASAPELIIKGWTRKDCDLLISSEELINTIGGMSKSALGEIFNEIRRIDEVTVVLTIRNEQSLLRSLIKQIFLDSGYNDIEVRLNDYKAKLKNICDVIQSDNINIRIINMDTCPSNCSLAEYYIQSICNRHISFNDATKYNISTDDNALRFFLGGLRFFIADSISADLFSTEVNDKYGYYMSSFNFESTANQDLTNLINDKVNSLVKNFMLSEGSLYPSEIASYL